MTAIATARTTYPLDALDPSPDNVRKKSRTPADIRAMAESIHAHGGLLQNLVVVPVFKAGKRTGRAQVTAGETRRLALCLLRDGGIPGANGFDGRYPVPVLEVSEPEAIAASATENIQRVPMHPADQFEAFQALHEQCGSTEHVAAMFGVKPDVVVKRLKLASASPRLLQVYRDDGMTLEQLMALSITDDHVAQERVWSAAVADGHWSCEPARLRARLVEGAALGSSPAARFVGVDAYERAGGSLRRDLFGDECYLDDRALLDRLVAEKLEPMAAEVRAEGWSWVNVRVEPTNEHHTSMHRLSPPLRDMSKDEESQFQAWTAEAEAVADQLEAAYDGDGESDGAAVDVEALEAKEAALKARIEALRASRAAWSAEFKSVSGAIVGFTAAGQPLVVRGLQTAEDRKRGLKMAVSQELAAKRNRAASAGEGRGSDEGVPSRLSESMIRRLTAHRTVALQLALANNTQVALAALTQTLVFQVFHGDLFAARASALQVRGRSCTSDLEDATEGTVAVSPAGIALTDLRNAWGERIPGDADKVLPWLIGLSHADLCDLLGLCVALTLNALQGDDRAHASDALASAVELDMSAWWKPSAAEYLARVPKALINEALAEGVPGHTIAVDKLKKDDAVTQAEALLIGTQWLPAVLRRRD